MTDTGIAVGGKHDGKVFERYPASILSFVGGKSSEDDYVFSGEYDDEGRAIFRPEVKE